MKIITLLIFLISYGCNPENNTPIIATDKEIQEEIAVLTTQKGEIHIKLLPKKAPQTVSRIKELISDKFYNGIQFHRVVPNFVVQAGDPTGTGIGGSGKKIKAEFNDEIHTKGTVAMARLGHDMNSADSQFYIALSTLPHLDKKYTVFGKVTKGIKVLDSISKGDKIISFKLK